MKIYWLQRIYDKIATLNTSGLFKTNTETEDGTIDQGGIREALIALNYGWVDAPINLWTRMRMRDNPTGVLRVFPERLGGWEFARKAYYDRNSSMKIQYHSVTSGAHGWTAGFAYTVPSDRCALHAVLYHYIGTAIATAGKNVQIIHETHQAGEPWYRFAVLAHFSTTDILKAQSLTVAFNMVEGEGVRTYHKHDDTVNHTLVMSSLITEFDA